jgi:hypothetical protein
MISRQRQVVEWVAWFVIFDAIATLLLHVVRPTATRAVIAVGIGIPLMLLIRGPVRKLLPPKTR